MADLKVGVIGCGGHAQSHLRMINQEPRMQLIAVAEIDETRLAQVKATYQPEVGFQDARAMLDQVALDVVYVVTQPKHALPIVLECLARGLHTSVEKPAGMSSEETRQMVEAAERSSGKAILSFNRRYKPEVLTIRQLLQDRGGAGQVAAIYHKPPMPDETGLRPGNLTSDAIHHVDLLRWMASQEATVAANAVEVYAHTWQGERPGTPHHNAVIQFDNGCHGVMMSHYGVGYRIQAAEFHAEDMSAYLDLTQEPQVRLYLDGMVQNEPLKLIVAPNFNETTHFADCILNETEPWSPLADALETMQLCEAIEHGHRGRI